MCVCDMGNDNTVYEVIDTGSVVGFCLFMLGFFYTLLYFTLYIGTCISALD